MDATAAAKHDAQAREVVPAEPGKPLYRKVKEDLVRRVFGGEWRPGERMPGEVAVASEYKVSVGTARKAIEELVASRLVVRQRGRGTTVAQKDQFSEPFRYYRFRTSRAEARAAFATSYLSCTAGNARSAEARNLNLTRGAPIVRARRLRTDGSRPAVVEDILLPAEPFPNIAERMGNARPVSIYGFLERSYHIIVARVSEKVEVATLSEIDACALRLDPGQTVLAVARQAFDLGGRVVEFRRMYAAPGIHYVNEIA